MRAITVGKVSAVLAALTLGGCAMSPAHVAQLPTDELCIDLAETLLRGGPASEGGMQTPVRRQDIQAALSARNADCSGNEAEYRQMAQLRLQNQANANANMTAALLGAAAYINATEPRPVIVPTAQAPAAPVYNGRPFTPRFNTPPPVTPPPSGPAIGAELGPVVAQPVQPIQPAYQYNAQQRAEQTEQQTYQQEQLNAERLQQQAAAEAPQQSAAERAQQQAQTQLPSPAGAYCYRDASGRAYCVPTH